MVWLGEISYEIFLLHVMVMAIAMGVVLRWPLFTGSMAGLFVATLAMTIPLAWVLRRLTGIQTQRAGWISASRSGGRDPGRSFWFAAQPRPQRNPGH
jgi:peptidoglycan/LPS O-acetylase OafA/YrhL